MSARSTIALAAVLFAAPAFATETFVIDKSHSEVGFTVRHLGLAKVRGRFTDFEGSIRIDREKPELSSVEVAIQVTSVDTDNPQRDQHLRTGDFFDVANFSKMSFKSSRILPKGQDAYEVTGTLTLRGVSKTITLPVNLTGFAKDPWGGERVGFELQTVINRKDYGVSWNKVMDNGGLLVSDEVTVTIAIEAVKTP